ncbi:MAG: hypothetical protein U5K54_19275 [Cytophagales bacterium]|nr:hypothetical protein [Cytophagales bacterium]
MDLFFKPCRIGINGPYGENVPILLVGARLSGKVNNTNIGFLSMFTDDVESLGIKKNNFNVARINQQLSQRSSLGAILSNPLNGLEAMMNDYNRTYRCRLVR